MSTGKSFGADPLLGAEYLERRENVRALLIGRGAREVEHLHGTLFDHLVRTEELLLAWRSSQVAALAGLCHAVYGTDGFTASLLTLDERGLLSKVAGDDVELLVYLYASCDRGFLYPQITDNKPALTFRDRFTQEILPSGTKDLQDFIDLTLANEFDVGTFPSPSNSPPEWFLNMTNAFKHLASTTLRRNLEQRLSDLSA